MITCSLVVILYHHDRSLLAVTHCQTRISSNSHTVKFFCIFFVRQRYCPYYGADLP